MSEWEFSSWYSEGNTHVHIFPLDRVDSVQSAGICTNKKGELH